MLFLGISSALPKPPEPDAAEEELLLQTGRGDKDAFRRLYEETSRKVYSFILSIVKNTADAEEILQDTYMKVWISAAGYQAQGKPLAWIFTIARNQCYMTFRSRRHEADTDLSELADRDLEVHCAELENAADRQALEAALGILAEDERNIVLLHATAGMKHREIADSLGLPLSTVLSKYSRAMKKMQKYLGEEG